MQELSERISAALEKAEERAELFANNIRLLLLIILTIVTLLNVFSVSIAANVLNFGALLIGYTYGITVYVGVRRLGYRPLMKYITSCLDIILVFAVLFLYTKIEIPSVALKHYVFLIVFPLIALTVFRYDRTLTLVAGGLTVALYLLLMLYLCLSKSIIITHGGYERELFTGDITYIGQMTKVLILCGFVVLSSYLAHYSQVLFTKLVGEELKLQSQQELIDWELKLASQVQTKFLPHTYPVIPGLDFFGTVEQGKYVGGDYCDFLKLADDKLLVVVADVSGKGVPAALIMAEVRASLQLLVSMQMDLKSLTERINTLLHQSTNKKDFVSFFAAEINTSRKRITYINAGHPPPLICSEGKIRSLAKGTIPLGLFASLPQLSVHSEEFEPGNVFVSFTDGILERTDVQGEQYGEERLRKYICEKAHLDARSFTEKLLWEIKEFGHGNDLTDDVSLAIAKYLQESNSAPRTR